ncbi:dirigent protein 15-like [Cryptomeria japonica]|uniref:dirigent protein 15-like n=1 Tax=Cryptomeria japonica TaxID=3369 RepID=UPI0027DA5BF9|nr:dirigent protein 15-like [Cryptomeria japonica]
MTKTVVGICIVYGKQRGLKSFFFLMLLIVWRSYASANRKLLTDSPKVEEEGSSSPKTITFFMHHLTGGPNPTANPGLGLGGLQGTSNGISGLPNQLGNDINFNGILLTNVVVIEDTLTEGPDLHSSAVLGKGEGYYFHLPSLAEDEDPETLLLAFTVRFKGSEYEGSSIEFSGKDNIALPQREITVVGGSGVFHNAQGHALIETVSHTVDETMLKLTATLTYK